MNLLTLPEIQIIEETETELEPLFQVIIHNDDLTPMETVKEAQRLSAAGRSVIHLSIGEPDFTAPPPVQAAACDAIGAGVTQYTPALGTDALRQAIANHYTSRFQLPVEPDRIVVTAGASAALLLAMAALLERGHSVLLADPGYPCNRHLAAVFEGPAHLLPCGPDTRFQPTARMIDSAWTAQTAGVLLASPSNPTGTSIERGVLADIATVVRAREGFLIVDEIYQGLVYDHPPTTALAIGEDIIALASFSKYFSMTGWRLGWLVAHRLGRGSTRPVAGTLAGGARPELPATGRLRGGSGTAARRSAFVSRVPPAARVFYASRSLPVRRVHRFAAPYDAASMQNST